MMQLPWSPGPGWVNTNPIYIIILAVLFTLPITLPILWKVYNRYTQQGRKKDLEVALTEKQLKKAERDRRKEIKRVKRKKGKF
jgi:hypothetical protein